MDPRDKDTKSAAIKLAPTGTPAQTSIEENHAPPVPPQEATLGGQGVPVQPQDGQDRGPGGPPSAPGRRRRGEERRRRPQPSLGRFGPRQSRGSASPPGTGGSGCQPRRRTGRRTGPSAGGRNRHIRRSVAPGQVEERPSIQQTIPRLGKFGLSTILIYPTAETFRLRPADTKESHLLTCCPMLENMLVNTVLTQPYILYCILCIFVMIIHGFTNVGITCSAHGMHFPKIGNHQIQFMN